MLEVFNTLLRQLRQSVDYELTGYYDNAAKYKTTSTEEKTLQDAVIKTIGTSPPAGFGFHASLNCFWRLISFKLDSFAQDHSPTRFPSTRGQRSCCSSWGRSRFRGSTLLWGRQTLGNDSPNSF